MVLRPRTRLQLRRAVVVAALGALVVPATASAATKKTPVIKKVTPKTAYVGTTITITGKHFKKGKAKNSVLFRRDKGKALFVKADVSTAKKLTVVVPKKLEKYMLTKGGAPVATRFRVRVLAAKLTKAYTAAKVSPVIGPERAGSDGDNSDGAGVPTSPEGDCDSDGQKNMFDPDDDNDLLLDDDEVRLVLDPCVGDTDGDGVEDGFEYQSAIDLNNDDYQSPNEVIPHPYKSPYPNPLFKDADKDYDGDSLALLDEYKLWKYTYEVNRSATRTLSPLSYSDGAQYSLSVPAGPQDDRREPTETVVRYGLSGPPQAFRDWTVARGYDRVDILSVTGDMTGPQDKDNGAHDPVDRDLYDMDRSGGAPTGAEERYWNLDGDLHVSDDERDEDADGLNNYHEVSGPMSPEFWAACYAAEGEYPIRYAGTKADDPDSDGDGIRDGADDQDFDDVPNIMELSRTMAGPWPTAGSCDPGSAVYNSAIPRQALVNPFNPCLPDRWSDTCPRHPVIGAAYAPFKDEWKPFALN